MNAKRQKRRVSFGQRRRVRTHKRSMIAIGTVLVLMIITLTVSGMSLKAKEQQRKHGLHRSKIWRSMQIPMHM